MEDKIILTADDGTEVTFYVIEETRLGASNYLLVADSDDEDAECLILKDTSRDEDPEAVYELVEDETELDAVSKVFEELLSDEDIPSITIETKKQTIVEMDIPAKPCTPVMEIWMWQSQGIVMGIMNLS